MPNPLAIASDSSCNSLGFGDTQERRHLHSRGFWIFTRLSSLLFALSLFPLLRSASLLQGLAHTALVLAVVAFAWLRPTKEGLAVGSGKRTRLIPWSRVQDIRELPWIRFSPPWYPKMWQVDLDRDRFDFCGVRNARQIVIEFVARAGGPSSEA